MILLHVTDYANFVLEKKKKKNIQQLCTFTQIYINLYKWITRL